MCRSLLFYSRYIAAFAQRRAFKKNSFQEFQLTSDEKRWCQELKTQGFTLIEDLFPQDLVDCIFTKADKLFRGLEIDKGDAYTVQNKIRQSLDGLSYEELANTEKFIAIKDPLINIPECVEVAFHPSLWRIICSFLGYIPPWFKPMVVRDFPSPHPRESSNFHKDNDEADSVQIFMYLVDIDESCGPLVYIPRTNRYDVQSCRPRLNRDLGLNANDGRISDAEIERYYPKAQWAVIKPKRGSVAIIHGNGLHKGPAWDLIKDSAGFEKHPRTAIRLDIDGYKINRHPSEVQSKKIRKSEYEQLSKFQKGFAKDFEIV